MAQFAVKANTVKNTIISSIRSQRQRCEEHYYSSQHEERATSLMKNRMTAPLTQHTKNRKVYMAEQNYGPNCGAKGLISEALRTLCE